MHRLIISGLAAISVISAPALAQEEWTLKLSGRVQLDLSSVDTDVSGASWERGELRRLHLGVSGGRGKTFKYKFEINTTADGEIRLQDGFVDFIPVESNWKFRAGQFKTPNTLDQQTSSRFISTLERAAFTSAFQFNRRLGVSATTKRDAYTFSAGIFGDNLDTSGGQQGYAAAARATFTPITPSDTRDLLVHLGASVRYREVGGTQGNLRYRQRPYAHVPGRIISTGRVAGSDMFYGIEAAALYQNVWVSGEYGLTRADCPACSSDPSLSGAYAEIGMMLGGRKTYKGGKFGRPKVDHPVREGGFGALALVARLDTIDLADGGLNGGDYDSYILGADWWPSDHIRLGLNLFSVKANLGNSTSGLDTGFAALVALGAPNEEVSGAMLRAQFDF